MHETNPGNSSRRRSAGRIAAPYLAYARALAFAACSTPVSGGGTKSSDKDFSAFSISSPVASIGVIAGNVIAVSLPPGTPVAALAASFTATGVEVDVGGTPQASGTTANDFTNPVTYVVKAEDGTTQSYTVSARVASASSNDFTSFSMNAVTESYPATPSA